MLTLEAACKRAASRNAKRLPVAPRVEQHALSARRYLPPVCRVIESLRRSKTRNPLSPRGERRIGSLGFTDTINHAPDRSRLTADEGRPPDRRSVLNAEY